MDKRQHELVLPNKDLPFKLFLFEGGDGNYIRERHWHRSVEIFAVTEGEIRFFRGGERTILKAGELLLINSNEVHSVMAPTPNTTIVLQIPLGTFEGYFTEERYIRFAPTKGADDEALMTVLKKLYRTYQEGEEGYLLKVLSDYYRLLYILVTEYREKAVDKEDVNRNKKLNKLAKITDYLRDHYQQELSLEKVAKIFGYSPTYLSHMFRENIDISYKMYLQEIRLEYALSDLEKGELTLSEIADKHGFASGKSFAKVFKRRYGILPSEYRRDEKR
ncbi:AraC family transcriptional regulator [Lachnospiraceae bacterium OttesenSCG-928-J05]|nr:AraC family transcriptional regulator [Lachnospiraceae bacterium OttesenSCG-928-J05]